MRPAAVRGCACRLVLLGLVACACALAPRVAVAAQPAADTARTLSLPRLLAEVRARNPSLRAARLDAAARAARPAQAAAWPAPSVGLTVQPFPVLTARGAQRSQWRVEQPLPTPGTRALRRAVAEDRAAQARLGADALASALALRVEQAYVALALAHAQQRLVAGFQAQLRTFEEAATTRYAVGQGSQASILKAQIERRRLDLERTRLGEDEAAARARLAALLDRDAGHLVGIARLDTAVTPPLLPLADLLAVALAERPEADARQRALAQTGREVDLARKAFWPDLRLSASYLDIAARDAPPTADGRDALAVGVGVRVPLDRAALRAGVAEARAARRAAATRFDVLRAQLRADIQGLTARLARQREQLDLLTETLLPQAEVARAAARSAYGAGAADFLALLDAERTRYQLRRDRLTTLARAHQTAAALARTLGVDTLDDLIR